jgi:hypothetical protein
VSGPSPSYRLCTGLRFLAAQPPFPTHLLLRDTLYLLQGIDGRYVRFDVNEAKGFGGGESEAEVVGIEIVADEARVRSCPPGNKKRVSALTHTPLGWIHHHANADAAGPAVRDGSDVPSRDRFCSISAVEREREHDRAGVCMSFCVFRVFLDHLGPLVDLFGRVCATSSITSYPNIIGSSPFSSRSYHSPPRRPHPRKRVRLTVPNRPREPG